MHCNKIRALKQQKSKNENRRTVIVIDSLLNFTMKLILMGYAGRTEMERTMEIVKDSGKCILADEIVHSNTQFIYVKYKNMWYQFDRFDPKFIAKVEYANNTYPFNHCHGIKSRFFEEFHIDDRFTNERYYTIIRVNSMHETVHINTNIIVDDLYNGTYLRCPQTSDDALLTL